MTILVTGATGCVGTYLVQRLLQTGDSDLLLVVRNPAALPQDVRQNPRVTVHRADFADPGLEWPDLSGVKAAILVATAWGGADAARVIRDANLALSDRLIAAGCGRILYFSTASVLDRNLDMLDVARDHGTEYIRGKHALTEAMETRADRAEVIGIFPTLVVGGAEDGPAPLSHFARLMHQLRRWVWLVRFLQLDAKLHIVHAADIATVVAHLAQAAPGAPGVQRLVLGNPANSVDDLVRGFAAYLGLRRWPLITLTPGLAELVIRVFRIQLSPWDRYCMEHPDQSYPQAVGPAQYQLPVVMPDLAAGLRSVGVKGRG